VWQTNPKSAVTQYSTAVKNTSLRAYRMPMYAGELWCKYIQSSVKRLRVVHKNAHRILHYIPNK